MDLYEFAEALGIDTDDVHFHCDEELDITKEEAHENLKKAVIDRIEHLVYITNRIESGMKAMSPHYSWLDD